MSDRIPKPEGFDLRDARSTRADGDSKMWTAHDALYSASQRIPENATSVLVIWEDDDGYAHAMSGPVRNSIAAVVGWMVTRYYNKS